MLHKINGGSRDTGGEVAQGTAKRARVEGVGGLGCKDFRHGKLPG